MPDNEQRSVFNDALADIIEISEELRSEIQRFENPSPHLVIPSPGTGPFQLFFQ